MDISFKTKEGVFNYRVCAIILSDNKILAMKDEHSPYYYLPGGRIKMKETAEDALMRELQEELQITPVIVRPLWLNQAFFNEDVNKLNYHELCFYYLVDISKTNLLSKGKKFHLQEKSHSHLFEWLPVNTLKNLYFYPLFLKKKTFQLPNEFTIITELE